VNLSVFGHTVPISGAIKSTFPTVNLQPGNLLGNCEERLGLRVGVLGAIAGALALVRRGRADRDLRYIGLAVGLAALGQGASLVLFQGWSKPTPPWYLATLLPFGVFAAVAGLLNITSGVVAARITALVSVGGLATNLLWASGHAGRLAAPSATYPGADRAPDLTTELLGEIAREPREAVWAATDCGKAAFWSGRRFVNLDGLVNDFAFQRALANRGLGRYLADHGVDRLVFGVWNGPPYGAAPIEPVYRHRLAPQVYEGHYEAADYFLFSYVHGAWSDTLRLPRERERWRSGAIRDGRWMARLIIYDAHGLTTERVP
jgi:hypothetical protein